MDSENSGCPGVSRLFMDTENYFHLSVLPLFYGLKKLLSYSLVDLEHAYARCQR